jgi:hypothetical protein
MTIVLLMVLSYPLRSDCSPEAMTVAPDPAGVANDFITGLTGSAPAALGLASDGSEILSIGQDILKGDHKGALSRLGLFLSEKSVGTVPVIGQFYAIGKLGKTLGDMTMKWAGEKNFNDIFRSVQEAAVTDSTGGWPKNLEAAKKDDFFYLVFKERFKVFDTYLQKTAGIRDPQAREDIAIEMILAKGRMEDLFDKYGLTGKDRVYENLQREIEMEAEIEARFALRKEEERVAALIDQEKDNGAEDPPAQPEIDQNEASLPEPEMPEDYPQQQAEKTMPQPEEEAAPSPAAVAKSEPEKGEKETLESKVGGGPLSWSIDASTDGPETTVFRVSITNISDSLLENIVYDVQPLNEVVSGGVGFGTGSKAMVLPPGASGQFTVLSMGDTEGVLITLRGNGKNLATMTAMSVHEIRDKQGSGSKEQNSFHGTFRDIQGTLSGNINIYISNGGVTGDLSGSYRDQNQVVSITAAITGVYEPLTAILSCSFSGRAIGKMEFEDEKQDVDEPISGSIGGVFGTNGFSGKWSGESTFISLEGRWEAKPGLSGK